jgi:serine/threonine-protein kinase
MRALAREAQDRFATARDMARAIERAVPPIAAADVGEWVERMAEKMLASRAGVVARIERSSPTSASPTVEANDAAATQVSPAPFYPSPSAIAEDAATELSSESASRPRGPVREGTRSLVLLAGIVGAAAVGICGTVLLVARGTAAGGKDSSHPPASATETPLVPAAAAVAVASAPELASASPSSSAALAPSAASGAVVPPRPAPRPGRPATNAGPLGGVLDSRK